MLFKKGVLKSVNFNNNMFDIYKIIDIVEVMMMLGRDWELCELLLNKKDVVKAERKRSYFNKKEVVLMVSRGHEMNKPQGE